MQPTIRGKPLPVTVHSYDTPEKIEQGIRDAELASKMTGTDLRIIRSSGRSMVSMHGISQEKWDKIFGKKKRGKGK